MSAVLIITIFLLVAITFVFYRTKRRSLKGVPEREFFQRTSSGLFDNAHNDITRGNEAKDEVGLNVAATRAEEILKRARTGDLQSLYDARSAVNPNLYDEALNALVKREASADNVRSIASFVIKGEGLRSNLFLTGALRTLWKLSPDEISTADFLRVAALSGDASLFQDVVEDVLAAWKDGRGWRGSSEDLRRLIESEYWVLSSDARRSGAGFLLKQTLAEVGPRLAAVRRRETLSAGPEEV